MLSSLKRGVRLVRTAVGPAAFFGAGYTCCWSQGREESTQQLLACAAAKVWIVTAGGLSGLGHLLPESAEWPRQQLAKVEDAELRVLVNAVSRSTEQGIDCSLLRRILLQHLCEHATENLRGPAVQGLGVVNSNGIVESASVIPTLCANIDRSAAVLDGAHEQGRYELLLPLTGALQAIVSGCSVQELGCHGVLHVAHAAAIASSWTVAEPQQGAKAAVIPTEDGHAAIEGLCGVWKVLATHAFSALIRKVPWGQRTAEAADVQRNLQARLKQLQGSLPPKLRAQISVVVNEIRSGSSAASSASSSSGTTFYVKLLVDMLAWAVLLSASVVAISKDGIGILPFQVVPAKWRASLQDLWLEHAVKVEDLLEKDDPYPSLEGSIPKLQDTIQLGPWGTQSYIRTTAAVR